VSDEAPAGRKPRFLVLGPLSVELAGATVPLGGRLRRALLADLILHAGEVLPVDRIVDDLWGTTPPDDPVNTLQVYVGQLRRVLEPDRRSRGPARVLVSTPPGYQLVVDDSSLDVLDFEKQIREARALLAQGNVSRARTALHEALLLWRGPPLPEFADAPFARPGLARLEELRLGALEERLELDLTAGQHTHVVAELETLTSQSPFRERLWELRVLALYRADRQAEALAAYQQLRRLFRDELGIDPGTRLQELERAVLSHDPALAPAAQRPVVVRAGTQAIDPLIGRRAELEQLELLLPDTHEGTASLVLITGEAGTGKSRLVAELATMAWASGASVSSGRCFAGDSAPAFAPVLECLVELARGSEPTRLREAAPAAAVIARLLPELTEVFGQLPAPTPLPPEEDRLRLYDAAGRMLVILTRGAPALLILDDLHWADEGSLSLAAYLLRVARHAPLLLVGCYRADEVPAGSAVARGLATLGRESSPTRIALHPLSDEEATALVLSVLGRGDDALITQVVRRGGGHPFFLRELARSAVDGLLDPLHVPPAARDLVHQRLQGFPDPARRLAAAASVFDGPWDVAVAAAAARLPDDEAADALDELILGGLVIPTGSACEFVHDIARQAIYDSLTLPRRASLHRAAARAVEQLWSVDRQHRFAAELARHYACSTSLGPDRAGAEHADRAAAAAEAVQAHDDAARRLKLAIELLPTTDADRLPRLHARRGRAMLATGAAEAGLQELAAAIPLIEAAEGPEAATTVLADAAEAAAAAANWSAAAILARRGLELVADDGEPVWSRLQTTALLAEGIDDPQWPGIILGTADQLRLAAAVRRLPADARPQASVFFRAFASREDVYETAVDDPGALTFWAGDFRRALEQLVPLADQEEESGQLEAAVLLVVTQARCHTALGEFARADAAVARGVDLVGRLAAPSVFAGHLLASEEERWAALGEGWGNYRFDVSAALDERRARWYAVVVRASTARVMAHLGAPEDAMARLVPLLDAVDAAPGWAENYPRILFAAAEVHWLAGRSDHAQRLARNAAEKVLSADFRYPMTDVRLTLARLAAVQGRDDEALDWFAQARTVIAEQGALPLSVVLDHDEAVVQLRTGHRREASALRARALATAEALNMQGWARALAPASRSPQPG
jgi:DNA-binding SARP family transcriptional activator